MVGWDRVGAPEATWGMLEAGWQPARQEDRHLAEEAKRRTLWENAADLFHID